MGRVPHGIRPSDVDPKIAPNNTGHITRRRVNKVLGKEESKDYLDVKLIKELAEPLRLYDQRGFAFCCFKTVALTQLYGGARRYLCCSHQSEVIAPSTVTFHVPAVVPWGRELLQQNWGSRGIGIWSGGPVF